ncbi:hypothetical protein RAS2_22630 [Phycisphaerae bacterium RAS2]|nr:hypothetical protein RAS2_22630 [Phycisphaerae bacterium RAS2]
MNYFQLVVLAVLAGLLALNIVCVLRGWTTKRASLLWAALCVLAGVATAWPASTGWVAQRLGIGRGADLVFYCAVVVMMIGFWMVYLRLRHLGREMTLLVRHLAILEAERDAAGRADLS